MELEFTVIFLKVILTITAIAGFSLIANMFFLWIKMNKDEKYSSKFINRIFPMFLLTDNVLLDENKKLRNQFVSNGKYLLIVVFITLIALCAVMYINFVAKFS